MSRTRSEADEEELLNLTGIQAGPDDVEYAKQCGQADAEEDSDAVSRVAVEDLPEEEAECELEAYHGGAVKTIPCYNNLPGSEYVRQ